MSRDSAIAHAIGSSAYGSLHGDQIKFLADEVAVSRGSPGCFGFTP
jgi:hypothetical protein